MCGICGKINYDSTRPVKENEIKKMMNVMHHRGPDDEGIFISKFVGFGHKRLSIIDLDSGKQPICNENKTIWIIFNGEIYNFTELRSELLKKGHIFKTKTDTEVIIHLYEELGDYCVSKLRGMFAFAIWDANKRRLLLARDRVGIKPFYYTTTRKSFVFASEIKALLEDELVTRVVNPSGLMKFLTFYYTPGPETTFKNIYKLQPGHCLTFENGKISKHKYWDILPFYLGHVPKSRNIESELKEIIHNSVKCHMISDVPVGFLLSGGVDSTGLLSFAVAESKWDIKSFTIGFDSQSFVDERQYARIAARKYGLDHYETTISAKQFFDFLPQYVYYMEEPICEPPAVALYFISKLASEHVKVLISGEGGDEAFAGYQNYRNLYWLERLKRLFRPLNNNLSELMLKTNSIPYLKRLFKYAPLMNLPLEEYYYSRTANPFNYFNIHFNNLYNDSYINKNTKDSLSEIIKDYFSGAAKNSDLNKMLYIDTKTWLPDDLLIKADKITMANSLELRVPLLDHKVLEYAAALPDHYKLNGITTKYILKKVLSPFVPEEIIKRKKTGFPVPYEQWLNNEYRDHVFNILMDNKTLERGYFKKAFIRQFLEKEWAEKSNYSKEIFSLLTLELWHRLFIDDNNNKL